MTQFNFTVSERVNVFGVAPTDVWNAYLWNAFKWGEGTAPLPLGIALGIAESQASTATVAMVAGFAISVAETQASTAAVEDVFVRDENGYLYVFPDRATDFEDRDEPSWTTSSTTAASWTSGTAAVTTWS